jgi:FtsP/CotA-like multicopper oxidase with cupredoxin domain
MEHGRKNEEKASIVNNVRIYFFAVIGMYCACNLTAEKIELTYNSIENKSETVFAPHKLPLVVPNENRAPAGVIRDGILHLQLEARQVSWQPEKDAAKTITVLSFAEKDKLPQIPGPLVRVLQGTEIHITIRNLIPKTAYIGLPPNRQREKGVKSVAGSELTVHGLRAGTVQNDTLHIPTGETQEVRFRAKTPGTFLYWGAMSRRTLEVRTGTDSQLSGAIVVDPIGTTADPNERIFVITMTDAYSDSSKIPPGEEIFKPVINGLSWPHTERLHYEIGDVVRWRWVNGTFSEHPMHLHGFHFRTLARSNGDRETIYPPDKTQLAVTELIEPGGGMRMEWVPTRAGNWLMHCHLRDHIIPSPERDVEMREHDLHDVTQHALSAMAGLVLGITVAEKSTSVSNSEPHQKLWLVAKEKRIQGDAVIRGFVVQNGPQETQEEPLVPGPPLILTRGKTTTITVVNQMTEPTTVHWHGMELESVYDGVAGWSRTGSRVAPLLKPGETFAVQITPPRAGTFMYHTHMDETDQIRGGLYGPLMVLEPDEIFNPDTNRVIVIGGSVHEAEYHNATINGQVEPAAQKFHTGTQYRLRFINISPDATVEMALLKNGAPQKWISIANDGADLPPSLRVERAAKLRFSAGQTYDYLWTPESPGNAILVLHWPFPTEPGSLTLHQVFEVR